MKYNSQNFFNKLVALVDNSKTQKRLTVINLTLSLVSMTYIYIAILDIYEKNLISVNFEISEVALLTVFYLSSGILWSRFLVSNYNGDFKKYFYNWSYSKLGKYIPSGLLTISTRLNQELPRDKNSKTIFFGLLEEQFLIPLISIIPLTISIYFNLKSSKFLVFFVSFLLTFICFKLIYKKLKINFISITSQNFLFLLNQFLPLSIYYLIAQNLNYENPLLISLIYLLSSYIGLFFIGVPAAIGIREAIFIFASLGFYDELYLFPFLIKTRILLIVLDLIFGIFGLINQTKLKPLN
jgi:hypothetical protein